MSKPLPDTLESARAGMTTPPQEAGIDCDAAAAVIDWYYRERWQDEQLDVDALRWLLAWMRHCHDPRRFEIADGLCVTLMAAGELVATIEMAESLLAEAPDPALTHTLALARAAHGEHTEAIRLLTELTGHADFGELPPEVATQVHWDLATLHRQKGSLFKAIGPLTRAVETAGTSSDPELLIEAADRLIEQLVEQGGAEEALDILAPQLSDERIALWRLVLTRLHRQLDAERLDHGMALMIAHGEYRAVLNLLVERATSDPEQLQVAFVTALALNAPAEVTCPLAARLLATDAARQAADAPLIAAASVAIAETQEEKNTTQAKWHRDGVVQLISVAKHQGILEEEVREWADNEGLYHEQGIIERAARHGLGQIENPPQWLCSLVEA
ncbi:hypothetical protein P8631_01630 [Guyparkeria sp. 1SP6A2]|nr:hypothetical protein [Guyparkeria sp. 1SP6A2]